MKGLRWPLWPAPATRHKVRPTARPKQALRAAASPVNPRNEITLALLEEHPLAPETAKGYDPYNAGASGRPLDVWKRKPKRD